MYIYNTWTGSACFLFSFLGLVKLDGCLNKKICINGIIQLFLMQVCGKINDWVHLLKKSLVKVAPDSMLSIFYLNG